MARIQDHQGGAAGGLRPARDLPIPGDDGGGAAVLIPLYGPCMLPDFARVSPQSNEILTFFIISEGRGGVKDFERAAPPGRGLLLVCAVLAQPGWSLRAGFWQIQISETGLITDPVATGGLGGALLNAALVLLLSILLVRWMRLPVTGATARKKHQKLPLVPGPLSRVQWWRPQAPALKRMPGGLRLS